MVYSINATIFPSNENQIKMWKELGEQKNAQAQNLLSKLFELI